MVSTPEPAGPVVAWRPATGADVPALTELLNASRVADGMADELLTADEVAHELEDPGAVPATDSRVGLDAAGRVLAWGAAWCRLGAVNLARAVLFGDVHPSARRQGVGRALLAWELARARERLATELPAGIPRRIDLYAPEGDPGRTALARDAGMVPLRWFRQMRRSLADGVAPAPLPPELSLVPWSDAWSEATRAALDDAWRDAWGAEPITEALWRFRVGAPSLLPDASRLAVAGTEVAGFVLCAEGSASGAAGERDAWLDLIAVRRAWRRQGVASALITAALGSLRDAGFSAALLDVDSGSATGAPGLYARHGFEVTRTTTVHALEVPPGS
ncbi:MAG: GNAT family N-acetyltransferase [Chloroflexota bacterium]